MKNPGITAACEYILWTIALLALAVFFAGRQISAGVANEAIKTFKAQSEGNALRFIAPTPDQELWSSNRIMAFDAGAARSEAKGLLHIPKLDLVAPIQSGTDEYTLNTFIGHSSYGANFGEGGNLVLAAHRDSYFRELGKLLPGDRIALESHSDSWNYRVTASRIIAPEDLSAMQVTDKPTLTLITCYPFYFLGPAPKRYVVTAELLEKKT